MIVFQPQNRAEKTTYQGRRGHFSRWVATCVGAGLGRGCSALPSWVPSGRDHPAAGYHRPRTPRGCMGVASLKRKRGGMETVHWFVNKSPLMTPGVFPHPTPRDTGTPTKKKSGRPKTFSKKYQAICAKTCTCTQASGPRPPSPLPRESQSLKKKVSHH